MAPTVTPNLRTPPRSGRCPKEEVGAGAGSDTAELLSPALRHGVDLGGVALGVEAGPVGGGGEGPEPLGGSGRALKAVGLGVVAECREPVDVGTGRSGQDQADRGDERGG